MSNVIVNTYWEALLPRNFQKPGQNATAMEVENFIKDKYIKKRWADPKMKMDPVSLFKKDRSKFEKYVESLRNGGSADDDGEENSSEEDQKPKKKKDQKKKSKKSKKDEDRKLEELAANQKAEIGDLIGFES